MLNERRMKMKKSFLSIAFLAVFIGEAVRVSMLSFVLKSE